MNFFILPNTKEYILKKVCNQAFLGAPITSIVEKNTMEGNGAPELLYFPHSSDNLPLCSAEQRHSYRFGTTWGWVNNDIIFIFGWTIPLRSGDWLGHSRTSWGTFLLPWLCVLGHCHDQLSMPWLALMPWPPLTVHCLVNHPFDVVQLSCPLSRKKPKA